MLIGELATRTGVSRRSLRYYEQRGLLHADRSVSGWREYSEEAVTRVRNVHALLAAGLSVDDILRVAPCLSQDLDKTPACAEAIEMYSERLAAVNEQIKVLEEMRSQLLARLDTLGAAPKPQHELNDTAVA